MNSLLKTAALKATAKARAAEKAYKKALARKTMMGSVWAGVVEKTAWQAWKEAEIREKTAWEAEEARVRAAKHSVKKARKSAK